MSRVVLTTSPELIKWARESIFETLESAAEGIGVTPATLTKWETDESEIALGTLKKIAKFYKRPIAVFFLPKAPIVKNLPVNKRSILGVEVASLSRELRFSIRRASRFHTIIQELVSNTRLLKTDLPVFSLKDNPEKCADEIRKKMVVSLEVQRKWRDPYKAYNAWVKAIESFGVLVFRNAWPIKEGRGYALTLKNPAIIVLNSKDAPRARIFSLFHELCHLTLAEETDERSKADASLNTQIEKFCNAFAAEILLPMEALKAHPYFEMMKTPISESNFIDSLHKLVADFQVSEEVILIRLKNVIPEAVYKKRKQEIDAFNEELRKQEESKPPKNFVISPAQKSISERGVVFTGAVIDAYKKGEITVSRVSDYLGVNNDYIRTVEMMVEKKRI